MAKWASIITLWIGLCMTSVLHAQQRDVKLSLQELCLPYENNEFLQMKDNVAISGKDFLSQCTTLLNLPEGSEMKFVSSRTDEYGITHTKYQQYYHDIAVMGGEMIINEKAGRVIYVNGMYMTTKQPNYVPKISAEEAFQTSLSQIKTTDYVWLKPSPLNDGSNAHLHSTEPPVAELLWVSNMAASPKERTYTLGWKHSISVRTPLESHDVYIDATTGKLLLKIPLQFNCTQGTCQTLWNGQKNISTTFNGNTYIAKNDCNPANIYVRNANINFSTITDYSDSDNIWPNTLLGKYIGETMYAMEQTRNYYTTVHNRSSFDSAGYDYNVYLNAGFNNNAYYDNGGNFLTFGGNTNGDSAVVSLDIAGHEATHGMVDFTSGLVYSYQSGALNESFADIFGEMVERYARGSHDWLIGADIYMGAFRNMSNPMQYFQPHTYQGTYWTSSSSDNGGVHTNSGVQNYWFYLLVNGGSGTNSNNYSYTVSGIGYEKARLITYQTMLGLTSTATYTNAKDVSIAIATSLYGQCSNEVMQVRKAWAAVGVGDEYAPYPTMTVSASTNLSTVCDGYSSGVTLTATGATLYSWLPTPGSGSSFIVYPTATTTYTVLGTNALGSCGGTSVVTINVNPKPTITSSTNDNSLCSGQSTTITAAVSTSYDTLFTSVDGWYASEAITFDIQANASLTLRDFKVNMSNATQVKIWYKFGGINNQAVTSSTGWFQLGSTINVTSAGQGNQTLVHPSATLTLSAGQTVGIVIACNGSVHHEGGSINTPIIAQNSALQVTNGFSGSGFNGTFNIPYVLAVFNGSIIYNLNISGYSWSPASGLSSTTVASPTCSPTVSTTYTVTASNGFGCTATSSLMIYVNNLPQIQSVTASAQPVCLGSSAQLNVNSTSIENDQLSTSITNNGAITGTAFDVTAIKAITMSSLGILTDNSTLAEVWYKAGGYGGANFTGSVGWTKLGNTISISPAGLASYTNLNLSIPLTIPAGQTYGIVVVTNGNHRYKNGTLIGNVISSNQDISIKEGHIGSGFGGSFNFNSSPKIWCGRISYSVNNAISSYVWSGATLSGATLASPSITPTVNSTYTVSVTDGNGCTASSTYKAFVRFSPQVIVAASPAAVCSGSTTQMMINNGATDADYIQVPATGTATTATNGGVVFNITTTRSIILQGVKLHIQTGATQAEVWYKTSSYGNANLTSSTGWTKLGSTVSISAAGIGSLTSISLSQTLSIPANATYGIAIVCNGIVRYSSGTAVGNIIQSTPELSVMQGHAGTGFSGVFNFTTSPVQFNGEISYSVQHSLSTYSWSPTLGVSNTTTATPFITPVVSGAYTVNVTDVNGCSGSGSVGIQVLNPSVGPAVATPSSICVGGNSTLSYTAPSGNQCHGTLQSGFAGSYAPATWTTVPGGLGTVTTSGAPSSITITSGNTGVNTSNITGWQHAALCSGYVTFNWSYSSNDIGPHLDYPRYSINGASAQVFPTFDAASTDPRYQNGTFSMFLNAGDVLQIQMYTANNTGGGASLMLIGFSAPYPITSTQTVQWYNQPTGGTLLGSGTPLTIPVNTAGNPIFYAAVTNTANGCTSINRVPTNSITVNALPTMTVSGNAGVCAGSSIGLSASGAVSYQWQPGNLSGSTITVSPSTATTYTVTGTSAQGCTSTEIKSITVYSLPALSITGNSSVCSGSNIGLTATGAFTYVWQPGTLAGSTININPTASVTYTVTGTSFQGCTNTVTKSITVNPLPTVNVTTSSPSVSCGNGALLTASGALSYYWMPNLTSGSTLFVNPTNTTTYTVTGTSAAGCTATSTKTIVVIPCTGTLGLNLLLEGYHVGNGQMTSTLYNQGMPVSPLITDSITIGFHSSMPPYTELYSVSTTVKPNGYAECAIPSGLMGGSYYLAIHHRNSIETWSALPITMSALTNYDFTNDASQAYGNNLKEVEPGFWAIYSGDVNQDNAIDAFDYILMDADIINGQSGYFATDITGDGVVDAFDYLILDPNLLLGVGSIKP